jgi:anti-sigma factor RsiW
MSGGDRSFDVYFSCHWRHHAPVELVQRTLTERRFSVFLNTGVSRRDSRGRRLWSPRSHPRVPSPCSVIRRLAAARLVVTGRNSPTGELPVGFGGDA